MKNKACSGAAFRAVTVATFLLLVLLLSCPATATPALPYKVGTEVRVNTKGPSLVDYAIAGPVSARRSDGKYIVIWYSYGQDGTGDGSGVYMRLYNADRTRLGGEVRVNTHTAGTPIRVSVGPDNSFVVCWYINDLASHRVFAQAYNNNGDKVGSEFQVTSDALFPDVAILTNGDIVFSWYLGQPTYRVSMRRYSSTLTPLDTEVEAYAFPGPIGGSIPRIAALAGGGFVIVLWANTGGQEDIYFQLFNNAGTKVGAPVLANSHTVITQREPAVAALPNGGFVVTWAVGQGSDSERIAAQRFSATGTPLGTEFVVNTQATGLHRTPSVASFYDNSFAITWSASQTSSVNYEVYVQLFGADGTKIGPETQVNIETYSEMNQVDTSIAANWVDTDKGFGVFYSSGPYDIAGQWLQIAVPTPVPVTPAPVSLIARVGGEIAINTYAAPSLQGAVEAVRRTDGKYVVVWMSNDQDGSSFGIYMQLMNADGSKFGGEVGVNTNTASFQIYPHVATAPDNSFVVCWPSFHLGSTGAIFAQAYSSTGAAVGGEFQVSSTTSGFPLAVADAAYLTNGDIMFCWSDGLGAVFTRLYSPAFTPRGNEVQMQAPAAQAPLHAPRIAALTGGGFVIVYYAQDAANSQGNVYDVYFQLHTNAGTPVGVSTQVNVFAIELQYKPHVAALPDGGFIVVWGSALEDEATTRLDKFGVVAAHFSATGARIGTEFVVNSQTGEIHEEPKVATFSNNSFAITWHTRGGASQEVYFQYFDANHDKIGPAVLANTRTDEHQYLAA